MDAEIRKKSKGLAQMIETADKIAIIGHIRPDGDCIGSNLAMYNYITDNYPDKTVDVYDEPCSPTFKLLSGYRKIKHEPSGDRYDLAISIDVSEINRLGKFLDTYNSAISTVCIDHHISNTGFGDLCYIVPQASSACEVMCDLIDMDKVSEKTASCLYLGIVHDTGVFKYSSTTRKTMELAGLLVEKGAHPEIIIDETFYKKTYKQNQLLAKAIFKAELAMSGKFISCRLDNADFKEFKCTSMDTEGIVEQLRLTDGVEVAMLCYQIARKKYKYSFRSKTVVDVNVIASHFGGGGHVRAAGFESTEDYDKILETVTQMIEEQLK
ncbi:MAG: bifunctional oligoribonuclease/PAP phosphatase NrnA [Eubacterium sp.]|nr:bifunctional oligoribonuclease/PAP phosphatase NrnA [Eubacterium sp.]